MDQESGRLAKNDAHAAEQAAKPAEHFLTAFANLDKDQSGELTPDELTDEMRKRQESMEKNLKRCASRCWPRGGAGGLGTAPGRPA